MTNILEQPYTDDEKFEFIAHANKTQRCIETIGDTFYALLPSEIVQNGEIVDISDTAEYQEKLTKEREKAFRAEFIELSIGCFRKQPQGYANAVEAFSRIDIKVAAFGGLTEQLAQIVTFYKKPDFTDPEACTEEAITKTAFNPKPMTAQEWALISLEFDTKWAAEEHKNV